MRWFRLRSWLAALLLALVASVAATRIAEAETATECLERVTNEVGEAMEGANFLERVALGVLWEVLAASCFFE